MLTLPQVTLCCVDTRLPEMALHAMKTCTAKVQFGDAILFTRSEHGLSAGDLSVRIETVDSIRSIEDYSRFLIKCIGPHVHTSHILVVQWDGYVLDAKAWDPAFLQFDYIGPVWPQFKDDHRVGNGGFSLRSRKLLDVLARPEFNSSHPEDVCIARNYRSQLEAQWGIRFADEMTAERFAFERTEPVHPTFGFHGMSNFPLIMTPDDLRSFVDHAPSELFSSVETRLFIKRALASGLTDIARRALQKRASQKRVDFADCRLWARLYMA